MHRRMTTYGLLTVACAALTTACGEDDNSARMMIGQGGSSNGGSGGSGTAQGGSGGGTPTGGTGGGGNTPAACTGCVELVVPFAAMPASRQAQFLFRPGGTTVADMTNGVVTWSVKAITGDIAPEDMFVQTFAQNGEPLAYAGLYGTVLPLTALNGFTNDQTWVPVVMDVAAAGTAPPPMMGTPDAGDAGAVDGGDAGPPVVPPPTTAAGFDKAQVFQWGLYVGVSATFAGTGTVRIAVDSVTYEGVQIAGMAPADVTFTTDAQGLQADPYLQPPGSTLVPRPGP